MMYIEVLQDYVQRAYTNYSENINTENDVTLLVCSFTGVMAVIDESVRKKFFSAVSYAEILKIVFPKKNKLYNPKDQNNKTLALYRHFRNALCHIKLEDHIQADDNYQIKNIRFEDYWNGQQEFDCTLDIDQLRNFFKFTVDVIKEKKKE